MANVATSVRALALLTGIAGCQGDLSERLQSGRVLALHGWQGRWVGSVTPADAACGRASQGLMSIGEKGFGLDPFQSTTVIRGRVGEDGHMSGSLARQGADHQDLTISFEGVASEAGTISGTLRSGRCNWAVVLHRG